MNAKTTTTEHAARLDDENAAYLPGLTAECERLGLTLQLTDDPNLNMPEIKVIDGRRTLLARTDEVGVAYDDVHAVGRCINCDTDLDDTAVILIDGSTDITGATIKICVPCQLKGKVTAGHPRTITYPLKTGGSLAETCPAWCTYDHTDDVARGISPENLMHLGDKVSLDYSVDGFEESILDARIGAWPFDRDNDTKPYVELVPEGRTGTGIILTSPLELAAEIRKVRGHLRALEGLAERFAEVQADDHASNHRGDLEPWASLTRTDLLSMPIAYLLKVFGVTAQESADVNRKVSVVLGGKPGDMLLLVHPDVAQHAREDGTRRALLAWYDARLAVAE